MLSSDIRAKYFANLVASYSRRQQWATWATLLFASADAVSFISRLPPEYAALRGVLAVLAAGASIYLALAQNERKMLDATDLHRRLSRLSAAYEMLWEDTYAEDALQRLSELDEQAIEASSLATSLANSKRLMRKWQDHTVKEYSARFAS